MKQLSTEQRVQVVAALAEGSSINSTVRMTGVTKPTILRLIGLMGKACQQFHDDKVRGLTSRRIQCDEIWSFVYSKAKNVPAEKQGHFGYGDVWTWMAIDADSKLVVSYMLGSRDGTYANAFMHDVADRLAHRVQLTTDGLKSYLDAVYNAFGNDIDYAVLSKIYGSANPQAGRYSPPPCIGVKSEVHCGWPKRKHVSTSYVERQNLTMRMQMRRFTRLTNAFSKKIENLAHNLALHYMHYNSCRVHQTLRVTPAMQAKIADHVWEIEELVGLLGQ